MIILIGLILIISVVIISFLFYHKKEKEMVYINGEVRRARTRDRVQQEIDRRIRADNITQRIRETAINLQDRDRVERGLRPLYGPNGIRTEMATGERQRQYGMSWERQSLGRGRFRAEQEKKIIINPQPRIDFLSKDEMIID